MSIKKISAMAVAGLMTLGVVAAFAQDAFVAPATPEEAVTARIALMKEDGGILRSAGNLTGAEAVAAMTTLQTNYSHIPALFPEGSIVGESKALPAIWENWDAFVAIAKTGEDAAAAGLAAAEAGDAAGYAAALQAIGATCGACHQQFRS
ncbi:c-type cytochrome [Devosia sp. SL43]|uniref:c-type cytochrome n=1 Tax=Devosia sp. SL43 TaxID=2806348 RepID=UPI001F00765B|nr:cytochrome c [Devosia sp. SL43]UJW85603.1 cytochrome c [Devosia sp. SL43]